MNDNYNKICEKNKYDVTEEDSIKQSENIEKNYYVEMLELDILKSR
jgi:hypothetical protein